MQGEQLLEEYLNFLAGIHLSVIHLDLLVTTFEQQIAASLSSLFSPQSCSLQQLLFPMAIYLEFNETLS